MREVTYREETKTVKVYASETRTCDLCGHDDRYNDIFDIRLESGIDSCGHERITRDICGACYSEKIELHWDAIYAILRADEDDDLREYHEDI